MSRFRQIAAIGLSALGVASVTWAQVADWAQSEHPGGAFTVYSFGQSAFTRAAPVLNLEDRRRFSKGSEVFRRVPAAASPLPRRDHNAPSCETCHHRNGRGLAHAESISETGFSVVSQMQPSSKAVFRNPITGGPAVARLERIAWRVEQTLVLSDGTKVELVAPVATIDGEERRTDLRNAPGVYGLGLIEAISDSAIRELAQARPYARLGIEGVAPVSERAGKVGRFGWKGRFASLDSQVHSAMGNELGLSDQSPDSTGFNHLKNDLTSYMRMLAVPARRLTSGAEYRRGAEIFSEIGCAMCHKPTWRTGSTDDVHEKYRDQVIHPFTDLLLHDMGEGLRDANSNDLSRRWRTPALWGIGMQAAVSDKAGFLHDGRARNLLEAILWHSGEAAATMRRFAALPRHERHQVLEFLSSL